MGFGIAGQWHEDLACAADNDHKRGRAASVWHSRRSIVNGPLLPPKWSRRKVGNVL